MGEVEKSGDFGDECGLLDVKGWRLCFIGCGYGRSLCVEWMFVCYIMWV